MNEKQTSSCSQLGVGEQQKPTALPAGKGHLSHGAVQHPGQRRLQAPGPRTQVLSADTQAVSPSAGHLPFSEPSLMIPSPGAVGRVLSTPQSTDGSEWEVTCSKPPVCELWGQDSNLVPSNTASF